MYNYVEGTSPKDMQIQEVDQTTPPLCHSFVAGISSQYIPGHIPYVIRVLISCVSL